MSKHRLTRAIKVKKNNIELQNLVHKMCPRIKWLSLTKTSKKYILNQKTTLPLTRRVTWMSASWACPFRA